MADDFCQFCLERPAYSGWGAPLVCSEVAIEKASLLDNRRLLKVSGSDDANRITKAAVIQQVWIATALVLMLKYFRGRLSLAHYQSFDGVTLHDGFQFVDQAISQVLA